MSNPKQTTGEYRVGLDFNPSGDPAVVRIKSLAASLIDELVNQREDISLYKSEHVTNADMEKRAERWELYRLAERGVEEAAMWGVKAATKRDPK